MIDQDSVTRRFVSVYYELKDQKVVRTKRDFCAHILITPSNFAFLERGERFCNLGQMCALINYWRVNPSWLMTGEGAMFYHPSRG